jgi:hypothetical protein
MAGQLSGHSSAAAILATAAYDLGLADDWQDRMRAIGVFLSPILR